MIISDSARQDLLNLRTYLIGNAGAAAADQIIDRLLDNMETLKSFPEREPIPEELQRLRYKEYRQTSVPPYRIIYKTVGNEITILLVADGRRDFRQLLTDRIFR